MFCESAVTYARGVLPHDDGTLTPQQEQDFKEANILKKVRIYMYMLSDVYICMHSGYVTQTEMC